MSRTLLICDDSLVVRSGLEAMLGKSGNWDTIITAENGKVGLDKIINKKPDAVVLDVEMPEMDGLQVLQEVKKLKREGKIEQKLPIIILSGTMYENDENVRKAKMYGAAEVMAKPEGKSATVMIQVGELEKKLLNLLA